VQWLTNMEVRLGCALQHVVHVMDSEAAAGPRFPRVCIFDDISEAIAKVCQLMSLVMVTIVETADRLSAHATRLMWFAAPPTTAQPLTQSALTDMLHCLCCRPFN
jgi:hypothetical protein